MSVVVLLSGRNWVRRASGSSDHIVKDGVLQGPTYISRDCNDFSAEITILFRVLRASKVDEKVWSTDFPSATVISHFYVYGYKLISQAGCGAGFSGGGFDPTATDFRWSWTLIRDNVR